MTIRDIIRPFFNKERGDDPWIIDCETSSGCPVWTELEKAGVIDVHIIPGAKALVTEKGLEDAAKVFGEAFFGCGWDRLREEHKKVSRNVAREALKEAGIVCVDEVKEVRDYCDTEVDVPSFDENGDPDYISIYGGDTLYIKRGKNDACAVRKM